MICSTVKGYTLILEGRVLNLGPLGLVWLIHLGVVLSINALFAFEKNYGNLTEIILENGLNNDQSREVAKALKFEIMY